MFLSGRQEQLTNTSREYRVAWINGLFDYHVTDIMSRNEPTDKILFDPGGGGGGGGGTLDDVLRIDHSLEDDRSNSAEGLSLINIPKIIDPSNQ